MDREYGAYWVELPKRWYFHLQQNKVSRINKELLESVKDYSYDNLSSIINDLYNDKFRPAQYNHPDIYYPLKYFVDRLNFLRYTKFLYLTIGPVFIGFFVLAQYDIYNFQIESFFDGVYKVLVMPIPIFFILFIIGLIGNALWESQRPIESELNYVKRALKYRLKRKFFLRRSDLQTILSDKVCNYQIELIIQKKMMEFYYQTRT